MKIKHLKKNQRKSLEIEKKMLNRCRQRKTRWQKGLEVWEILEDLKPLEFGKMSEYIIGSAQLALCYID